MMLRALTVVEPEGRPEPGGTAGEPVARHVRGTVVLSADEPFLRGHYPGLPVVPGFGLVQYVHELAAAAAVPCPGRAELTRARFLSPVRPGEEVAVDARIQRDHDGVRVSAQVSADDRPAAEIALFYPREVL
ncbi:hypothetical protein [Kitasatospora sp. NPDC001547]|uniref:hypothetical protein n=1 Tax=Kitasatospora sp. NPDC001547 TaxID=3364015 RepID=UPI0036753726|nr:hypothetical protein KitaXyl93_12480 [Kitasatospora sp. Xyl93]